MNSSPVFILTDFGTDDTYTGQMKASVLSFAGYGTPVVDLTNRVGRGNVLQGAYHLRASLPHLPAGSVTLAVIDPGVGSSRGGLAAVWDDRFVVAPDNGLISLLPSSVSFRKLPPPDHRASNTFHGRDWFAPCAARLAVDPGWTEFLEPLNDPVRLLSCEPVFTGTTVEVAVLHTDIFGNCILGLDSGCGLNVNTVSADTGDFTCKNVHCYSDARGNELLILCGSQGFMELAVKGGSAAELTGLEPGMRVKLTTGEI